MPVARGKEPAAPKEVPQQQAMLPLSDFGLYQCEGCGDAMMGYERERHVREAHEGKMVKWKEIRK